MNEVIAGLSVLDDKGLRDLVRGRNAALRAAWKEKDFAATLAVARELLDLLGDYRDARRFGHLAALRVKDFDFIAAHIDLLPVDELNAGRVVKGLSTARGQSWLASEVIVRLDARGMAAAVGPEVREKVADDLCSEAIRAMRGNDGEKAGQFLRRCLEVVPEHADAADHLRGLAKDSLRTARQSVSSASPEDSLAAWRRVLYYTPGHVEALRKSATAARDAEDWSRAYADWLSLLRVLPGDEGVIAQFARSARMVGEFARALEDLVAVGVSGSSPGLESLVRASRTAVRDAYRQGDPVAAGRLLVAMNALGLLAEQDNRLVQATLRRLRTLIQGQRKAGQLAETRKTSEILLALDPKDEAALSSRARLAVIGDDYDAAVDFYSRLVELAPDNANYSTRLERFKRRIEAK